MNRSIAGVSYGVATSRKPDGRLTTAVSHQFVKFHEMKASLWDLRLSLQGQGCFDKTKDTLRDWISG